MKASLLTIVSSLIVAFIPIRAVTKPDGFVKVQKPEAAVTQKLSSAFNQLDTLDEVPVPAPAVVAAPAPTTVTDCGDNDYAHYIYMHESGCRLNAVNSIGCIGIGQSCSPNTFKSICPDLDYTCENDFFSNYANNRYGGWLQAYNFWTTNHWW